MHPDILQAAAAERIERLERQARESALRRTLRAARARRRSGDEPGGGLPQATPEQPPAVPRGAAPRERTPAAADRVPAGR